MVYCDRGDIMEYNAYEIGTRAYNARINLSKKQSDISTALGISQSKYSRFECGKGSLPLSEIIKLCDYLGVSLIWLIGANDDNPKLTEQERLDLEQYKKFLISKRDKK
jgi:transcriptional regulator with XRE-family HTH domain